MRAPLFGSISGIPDCWKLPYHALGRNVQGLRFVPSMLRPERVEVERMLVKALMSNGLVDGPPILSSKGVHSHVLG